jgi:tetratricopeptide (TPR) repeat protein
MRRAMRVLEVLLGVLFFASGVSAQIGKNVLIRAGTPEDQALMEINATTDPAQKLALIDKFASDLGKGDMAIVADDLYVNYYTSQKNYDKAFEYGEKLFALDPDNFNNAVNLTRAAAESGDAAKLFSYGEKAGAILQRYKAAPPPAGRDEAGWNAEKKRTLEGIGDNLRYEEQLLYNGAYHAKDANQRAELMVRFAQAFPDSPYSAQALGVAAASYQQAQNTPKMLEVANSALAKDPNNLGMLLVLADYYSEKGEQLDKAEEYAKKAASLAESAKKPDDVTDDAWQKQTSMQKGLALSALGQVNIQKKDNATAVDNLNQAAPLVKADATAYARNQYRLAFALLNLKKIAEAKVALGQAASVDSPYKALAQQKLQSLPGGKTATRRRKS